MKREHTVSNPCLEGLEPRLLLSTSGLAGPEAFESAGIPAYIDVDLPERPEDDGISPCLRQAHADIEAGGDGVIRVGSFEIALPRANDAGELRVYVHVEAVNASIIRALEDAGLRVETSNARMKVVQGWLPHTDLDLAAAVEGVRRITPPAYGITNSGSVTTEGDADLNADDLRGLFGGITGDGVKIGVISDGVDHWEWVADDPRNDLPNSITVDPTRPGMEDKDEGTAMLEIIYDVAPGADLYFSGPATSAQMVDSIDWLVNTCGVDVIVDDLIFFDEPMFEDGPIADEAADAVTDGVVYVSAAGNWAEVHYQADYDPYAPYTVHEFATNQFLLRFELDAGGSVRGEFQWSDLWGSSGNDYNLYLYEWVVDEWVYVTSSTDEQDGDDDPRESSGWLTNQGESTALCAWLIDKASGSGRELELTMYYTDPNKIRPYAPDEGIMVPEDSIYGHAALEEVIAVGAIDTADSGLDDVEDFSSRGPSTIYTNFSTQTSTERDALDVCGIDGVQTKVGQGGYFFNPFFGTSAAAPHIAGIAGLLLEIESTLTPADIQDLITGNAVDIGDAGYDDVSGYGRADAVATVTAAATAADLKAASDTGTSDTDDLTKLDNSAVGKELQFDVTGTVAGATVTIYAGEIAIGTGTGSAGTTTVTTDGEYDLTDGEHSITARQTDDGKLESPATSALSVTVDTVAPTVDIEDVSPDPRADEVASIAINFSEVIDHTEFDMGDLGLTRDGATVSLGAADLIDSGNHEDWTLDDLDDLTDKVGKYELTLTASGSGIIDLAGNDLAAPADDEWLMHTVLGTGGADTISLAWNDGTSRTDVVVGETEYAINPANLTVLYVDGLAGDDELTVDFADGDPLPSGGLDYDGGDGTDTLRIDGSANADTVSCTTTQATVNSSEIDHTAVESLVLALEGGANAVEVEAGFGVDDLAILGGGSGSYTFEADDPDDTDDLELIIQADAEVTIETSLRLESLTLKDASLVTLTGNGAAFIHTDALSMEEDGGGSPTATLDLTDNNLIVDYDGTNPFSDIQDWIREGYNGGGWDGTGITSSDAKNHPQSITALGVIDNADTEPGIGGLEDLDGEPVDETSVLVKYTYYGDANLDGIVDSNDYDRIDINWLLWVRYQKVPDGGWRWAVGDFNYDGTIDSNDYDLIDNAYTHQGGAL
ncbi:MAG TPA: S8 family serine peptidase [Phycisphaerae bacterium]|nr:S8 family serine peptidase [Phycisphaerae bacterium]